jgi:hypothetical protein
VIETGELLGFLDERVIFGVIVASLGGSDKRQGEGEDEEFHGGLRPRRY